jgi:protein phosphatase 1 regulatory subunit 7
MEKKCKHNFDIFDCGILKGEKYQSICIESDRISQCMQHYLKEKLGGIFISKAHGYKLKDLKFLKDYPFITRVHIAYAPSICVSDLYAIPKLRSINIADNKEPIDISAFSELEKLIVDWHPKITFPKVNKTLKYLSLSNYKPKSKDLTELPYFLNVEELQIIRAPLISLVGLGRFKKLKGLNLAYLSKLERIAGLDAYSIEELMLDVCRKISDHAHVTNFPKLWKLMLCACGTVPSLKFLNRMPTLRWFTFVDTNVLDGDMTPCFRLESVGTSNKKHYSHTSEEIKAIIEERQKKAKQKK